MRQDSNILIETAAQEDLAPLLELYRFLNPSDPILPLDDALQSHWGSILSNPAVRYVVARTDGRLVASCALTLIPNLTRSARPYGLIENVITHPDYRKRGIGTQVLKYALDIACEQNCYKVMLLTGRKEEAVFRFYEKAGFIRGEKTGFVIRPGDSRRGQ